MASFVSYANTRNYSCTESNKRKHDDLQITFGDSNDEPPFKKRIVRLKKTVQLVQERHVVEQFDIKKRKAVCLPAVLPAPKKQKVIETTKKAFNFIFDQYTEARGEPKMLEISCRKCNAWVMDYQKDGPGNLIRCYVDRIYHPSALRGKSFSRKTLRDTPLLSCDACHEILARPMIYTRKYPRPEERPAYLIERIFKNVPKIVYQERVKQ